MRELTARQPLLIMGAFCVMCIGLPALAGGGSETKVLATAQASKLGADGKQTVTIQLTVEKGWYVYANPLKANTDVLDGNETRVAVKSKNKIDTTIKYPAGKQKAEGKYTYDIYEGNVVIEAQLQRGAGDVGPLQISIDVSACRKGECLLPATLKLTVP